MPENPRYKHVKPVVDTGASLRKYLEVIDDLRRNFKFRKDEVFKRIKLPTLINLMIEVSKLKQKQLLMQETNQDNEDSITIERTDDEKKKDNVSPRSGLHSLITGVGELDVSEPIDPESVEALLPAEDPYLLLDVRNPEEFSTCHIITAENYPMSMLARTMDFESKNLWKYKNKPGKIIVMYDDEELRAPKVATTLVQRGYDNIYMLSGGLRYAAEKFPKGLIAGTLPDNCQIKAKTKISSASLHNMDSALERPLSLPDRFSARNVQLLEDQLQNFFNSAASTGTQSARTVSSVKTNTTALRKSLTSRIPSSCSSALTKSSLVDSKSKPWK